MGLVIGQHRVHALGPHGPYPPLRMTVRPRRLRRDRHDRHALAGEDIIECAAEFGIPVTDEEPDWPIRSAMPIIRLRACWVVHAPSGRAVTPRMRTHRAAAS
jgi:hypothetical protein